MLKCEPGYEKDMQTRDIEEAHMWIDVGIWKMPLLVLSDGVQATKSMEKWLWDNGSHQRLYVVVEQSKEEFWKFFAKTSMMLFVKGRFPIPLFFLVWLCFFLLLHGMNMLIHPYTVTNIPHDTTILRRTGE